MHGYWQAVITSFEQELVGSRGSSLIPPEGLGMVVSPKPLFARFLEGNEVITVVFNLVEL